MMQIKGYLIILAIRVTKMPNQILFYKKGTMAELIIKKDSQNTIESMYLKGQKNVKKINSDIKITGIN